MTNTNHNLAPALSPSGLHEVLSADSTQAVRWNGNKGEPTTTVFVTEPGASFSAKGLVTVITDTLGNRSATDGVVAVSLPPYNESSGTFGNGTERVTAYHVKENPAVGNNIVVGRPVHEGGSPIKQVTIGGDELMGELHGVDDGINDMLQNPRAQLNLPDPTHSAQVFLGRAHRHFDAKRSSVAI